MGSKVLGVFYGCIVPEGLVLYDDESEDALMPKWEKAKVIRGGPKLTTSHPDGDKYLLGFWVAIGGNEKGIQDISEKCTPLTLLEKTKEATQAIASWKTFTHWAKANGVNIPMATFWLAPIEVG